MEIVLASDHAGFELKEIVKQYLNENNHKVVDFGTNSLDSVDYPDFARPAAEYVAQNSILGIIICGSGVGVSITANKVKGVRAANVFNEEMAILSKEHNNANITTLGSRFIDKNLAIIMVEKFIKTPFAGGRHQQRISKIEVN